MEFLEQLNLPLIMSTFQPSFIFLTWAFFYILKSMFQSHKKVSGWFFLVTLPMTILGVTLIVNFSTFTLFDINNPSFTNDFQTFLFSFIHFIYQLIGVDAITQWVTIEGDVVVANTLLLWMETLLFLIVIWFLLTLPKRLARTPKKYSLKEYKKRKATPFWSFLYSSLNVVMFYVIFIVFLELLAPIINMNLNQDMVYGFLKDFFPFELLMIKLREVATLIGMPF